MAHPSDTKPQSPAERGGRPDSDAPPKPSYDEKIEGDSFEVLRRYQEVTLPPNARLKLLQAPVPVVPPEQLQDTLPPNGGVTASAQATKPARATSSEAPVVDASRSQATMILPRVRRKQRLRALVIGSVVAAAVLAALGIWFHQASSSEEAPQPAQRHAAAADTVVAAPAAPLMTAPTPTPEVVTPQASTVPDPAIRGQESPTLSASPVASTPTVAKAPNKRVGEKSPATPTTTPKTTPAPATTNKTGSAFDGLMRPPSD